ncbi:MAG: ribonuclease P protein component [Candidatus Omnitrophica bacterium]|nr:ribonuclease P protein component [Candidatus Omnitrophota bacterium]
MKFEHLRRSADFREVLAKGAVYKSAMFTMRLIPARDQLSIKVGVSVSKKVLPKATKRNYIKRLIYAFFSLNEKKLLKEAKIVVSLKKSCTVNQRKYIAAKTRQELLDLCTRAAILT